MIELSVVTGTYNRIKYLQQMVASVRSSLGGRIPMEIVVVDGGSKDGTQKWCRQQEDIRLIEHKSLQGAVKAFNDGATAAVGKYVVLANDDITFNDKSLVRAIAYLELNPTVGIGCLYQDRGGREWHVEHMPAILNGKQVSVPYGQVCIVRKWLGDKVGWWGSITRTYGGDNELSCNVLEMGYKVEPIPCACISDLRVEDELRVVNGGTPADRVKNYQPHPDTVAWTTKWTHPDGKVGPIISSVPKHVQHETKRHRVLYAPIYEHGNDIQRQTKVGLLEALQRDHIVYEYDMNDGTDGLFFVVEDLQPTLFLLQIHDVRTFTPAIVRALKGYYQSAKFVSWNGDYHPEHLNDPAYIQMMKHFDLATFVTADIEHTYRAAGVNYMYWQIGYETPRIANMRRVTKHDVVFLGNAYSPARIALGSFLHSLRKRYNVGLYGKWETKLKTGENLYDFSSGHSLYSNAKLAISDQQWPRATGYVSNRLFQAMVAGGCMVLQQHFDGMEQYLGIQDGVHVRTWKTHADLERLIDHYMKHEDERVKISMAGQTHVQKHHSFDARVQELMNAIG